MRSPHFGPRRPADAIAEWELAVAQGPAIWPADELDAQSVPRAGRLRSGAITRAAGGLRPVRPHRADRPVSAGATNSLDRSGCIRRRVEPEPAGVLVTAKLDDAKRLAALQSGGKVLLLAHG